MTMIERPVAAIAFDSRDVAQLIEIGLAEQGYIHAELSPEQFEIFESFCSGSHLSGGFEAAIEWAQRRLTFLESEAREYEECGYGYDLPMGYCRFCALSDFVMYETTRGSLLVASSDGSYYVRIPTSRKDGYHHSILKNVMDGWSSERIDRRINPHHY